MGSQEKQLKDGCNSSVIDGNGLKIVAVGVERKAWFWEILEGKIYGTWWFIEFVEWLRRKSLGCFTQMSTKWKKKKKHVFPDKLSHDYSN